MTSTMSDRQPRVYDLIVFGATGYTGKLCAEYISTSLPTNLKWAIAGRSERRLLAIKDELGSVSADRLQLGQLSSLSMFAFSLTLGLGIEVASLEPEDLQNLAKKTRLLINTVGPYHLYSSPVVEACAKNGTHYLDVTGESPWVLEMIEKYHEIAKANHAVIIPEIGIESAPSDLLAFALVSLIRTKLSVGTKEVTASVHNMKGTPSGGSLATVLSIMDHYSLKQIRKSSGSWATSPVPRPKMQNSWSWIGRFLGVRSVPGLGTLTTSISAAPNIAVVQRSWGLFDGGKLYGTNFQYQEYMRVRNSVVGIAMHFAFTFAGLALLFPPVRWLAKKFLYAPGEGADKDTARHDYLEFHAVATADQVGLNPRRAFAKLRWDGNLYHFTGVCLAEAAMVLLSDEKLVQRLDGGLLTPATLGQPFIDRMKNAGLVFQIEMIPNK